MLVTVIVVLVFIAGGWLRALRQNQSHKFALGKDGSSFDKVWDSVKAQVDVVIDGHRYSASPALSGPGATATGIFATLVMIYGSLILDVKEGRISWNMYIWAVYSVSAVLSYPLRNCWAGLTDGIIFAYISAIASEPI